jgi:hypothetical protein
VTSHAVKSSWKCYKRLPVHVQKLADKNFALFRDNPWHPSLGFAKKGEIYTVEIGRSYRALARERNGHYASHRLLVTPEPRAKAEVSTKAD